MRTAEQNRGAQVAYAMAYFVLPLRAHNELTELRSEFEESPDVAALHYFCKAAKGRGVVPRAEDAKAIRAHTGWLASETEYIVIEYPRYPAVDLLAALPDEVPSIGPGHVLAPYFSAVVIDRGSRTAKCFVLGQSPDAGTTLRLVSPEMNANLGPGCEPELEAFMKLLRKMTRN